MKKINFLFGIHCHQPVGNFEHVLEDCYQKCYLPFIQTLSDYPTIKITLHYTGVLLDWFTKKHPEYIEILKKLVVRSQVEMMTGGFYEPILAIIPDADKIGQIKKQTNFIKQVFSCDPKGMWLAERIWEPHLAKTIAESGVEYIAVDDYHFFNTGLEEKDLNGYYVTEEQGRILSVFPISKKLRYLIPFKMPHETIDFLRQIATDDGNAAAIIADDGEKFGVWPGTNKWVYDERWLRNFFDLLQKNQDWINIVTFSEYYKKNKSIGRVYLPTASYFEMSQWSLPSKAAISLENFYETIKSSGKYDDWHGFVKGGFWRSFLTKYPESNNMQKKMQYLSSKLYSVIDATKNDIKISKLLEAQNYLWMGQCNCAYWHGVFGGLYLNYLRNGVYENLIKCESIIDDVLHGERDFVDVDVTDINKDAFDEILLSNKYLNIYISPNCGGSIFELDYKPKEYNLGNNLARRFEPYHQKLLNMRSGHVSSNQTSSIHDSIKIKEAGLENDLRYDRFNRYSLLDHILPIGTKMEEFMNASHHEITSFAGSGYTYTLEKKEKNIVEVIMTRTSSDITITKKVVFGSSPAFNIYYEIKNMSDLTLNARFAAEFNLGFLCGDNPDNFYEIPGVELNNNRLISIGENKKIKNLNIVDNWKMFSILFTLNKSADLWRFPVQTVSLSESGLEKTYQNCVVVPNWEINLKTGDVWTSEINVSFIDKEKINA